MREKVNDNDDENKESGEVVTFSLIVGRDGTCTMTQPQRIECLYAKQIISVRELYRTDRLSAASQPRRVNKINVN